MAISEIPKFQTNCNFLFLDDMMYRTLTDHEFGKLCYISHSDCGHHTWLASLFFDADVSTNVYFSDLHA